VEDDGHGEKDSKPSTISSAALAYSDSDQEVVQEEAIRGEIPSGWKRVELLDF
jgi:hypothetical protein